MFASLSQALAAAAASQATGQPIVLWSPEGAGISLGPGWVLSVARTLRAHHPGLTLPIVLDCADEPGAALAALRCGIHDLSFRGAVPVSAKLAAMGARLWQPGARHPGSVLDLTRIADPAAACHAFLATRSPPT